MANHHIPASWGTRSADDTIKIVNTDEPFSYTAYEIDQYGTHVVEHADTFRESSITIYE